MCWRGRGRGAAGRVADVFISSSVNFEVFAVISALATRRSRQYRTCTFLAPLFRLPSSLPTVAPCYLRLVRVDHSR